MAFVINKSEYKSVFEQKNKTPGPGAYDMTSNTKEENPAPFNASSCKISLFNVKQSNIGPGSYTKTSLHECFKTKTTCLSSFKSTAPRFPYQSKSEITLKDLPQVCQSQKSLLYCQNTKDKTSQTKFHENKLKQKKQYLTNLRKQNNQRKTNSIVNEQKGKIRILISNPKNTENIESFYIEQFINVKQANGPGMYDLSRSMVENNKSVMDWSKNKQKRFKKTRSVTSNLGPGYYQLDKKPKSYHYKRATSSFSSGQVRTFMDTLVYRTHSLTKVQIMQQKGIKETSPGPGDYTPLKPQKDSFYHGKQIMSSTSERFGIEKNKTVIPGPGYYKNAQGKFKYQGMVKQMRQKIFGKHPTIVKQQKEEGFLSLEKQLKILKQQTKQDFHQAIQCSLKERCQSKAGTLSLEPRFKDTSKTKTKAPGPGQYLSLFEKKPVPETSCIFKSGTEREPFVINQDNIQNQFYEIGKDDIAARTQKIRQNLKSLKKVAIQKPPFDSSVCRFPVEDVSKTQPSELPSTYPDTTYDRDQIDYDSFKPYKQKAVCASVFRSTTKRQPFVIKPNPGPGSYQNRDLLNKKSYNAQYYLADRQKALSMSKIQIR